MNKVLLVFLYFLLCICTAHGQGLDINDIVYSRDYKVLLGFSSDYDNERLILDALTNTNDINNMGYEEILELYSITNLGTRTKKFLEEKLLEREIKIYNDIAELSPENIIEYCNHFPKRSNIVWTFVNNSLSKNLEKIECQELYYLQSTLPKDKRKLIDEALKSRGEEKHKLLSKNVDVFLKNEKVQYNQLKCMLETISWTYFTEGHKQLTNAYSQISMVPDDAKEAANQYQEIIRLCFSPKQIRSVLQNQVDQCCEQINKARKDYALIAGHNDYVKCSYKVPDIKINSAANYSDLYEIGRARQAYLKGRQNISQGTSVIGFLTGGLWGLGAQALGEWLNISSLVDSEYIARRNYVEAVHNVIKKSFENNTKYLLNDFDNYISKNQKDYETFIKK